MRILILGGDGMLGHRLMLHLSARHDVTCTLRQNMAAYARYPMFNRQNSVFGVSAESPDRLLDVLGENRPDAVVNCIGIVKQRTAAKEVIPSVEINTLLPQRLALMCGLLGARLIHLSTDCVFSGRKGNYSEGDVPDAYDVYGRSKALGEVAGAGCLTLRTSIIGRELGRSGSLLEWFLAQDGVVRGFTKAIFTGFTTIELSDIIERLLVEHPQASGMYHVSSDPISKYDLLMLIKAKLGLATQIVPDHSFECDRSLDSSIFRKEFSYQPPTWDSMIAALAGAET